MILSIAIASKTEQDYDGVDEATKHVSSTIDSIDTHLTTISPDASSDVDCKTNHKAQLTLLGYIWDTEV